MKSLLAFTACLIVTTPLAAKKAHSNDVIRLLTGVAAAAAQQQGQQQQQAQYTNSQSEQSQLFTAEAQAAYKNGCDLLDAKQYRDSVGYFDTVIRLEPQFAKAYNCRATACRFLGYFEFSRRDVGTALNLNPQYVMALLQRGLLELLDGNDADGNRDINQAYASRPALAADFESQAALCRQYARAKQLISTGQPQEALSILAGFIETFPECYSGYLLRGTANRAAGNSAPAIDDLTKALASNNKDATAYGERAFALAATGEEKQAQEDLQKCREIDTVVANRYEVDVQKLLKKFKPAETPKEVAAAPVQTAPPTPEPAPTELPSPQSTTTPIPESKEALRRKQVDVATPSPIQKAPELSVVPQPVQTYARSDTFLQRVRQTPPQTEMPRSGINRISQRFNFERLTARSIFKYSCALVGLVAVIGLIWRKQTPERRGQIERSER
ncbi:MAG: tetratricopeptide repeat protein [Candidatus Sumerlaeaceae bacterium]